MTTETPEKDAQSKPEETVGAEVFDAAPEVITAAPEGTVIVLPGPVPVYLNLQGALAWIDREIARAEKKAQDPDYGENMGAMSRVRYLREERDKLAAAKGKIKPRLAGDFAHPEVPPTTS